MPGIKDEGKEDKKEEEERKDQEENETGEEVKQIRWRRGFRSSGGSGVERCCPRGAAGARSSSGLTSVC